MTAPVASPAAATEPGAPDYTDTPEFAADADALRLDPDSSADEADSGNSEAARWRRRLRETEAERDDLRERVKQAQSRDAERIAAAAGLRRGGDLWLVGGAELPALVGTDGEPDQQKVRALVAAILTERPELRVPVGPPSHGSGDRGPGPRSAGPSWADVLASGVVRRPGR